MGKNWLPYPNSTTYSCYASRVLAHWTAESIPPYPSDNGPRSSNLQITWFGVQIKVRKIYVVWGFQAPPWSGFAPCFELAARLECLSKCYQVTARLKLFLVQTSKAQCSRGCNPTNVSVALCPVDSLFVVYIKGMDKLRSQTNHGRRMKRSAASSSTSVVYKCTAMYSPTQPKGLWTVSR